MPSVSDKQRKFMSAACHNADFASKANKGKGISQDVACQFHNADKGSYGAMDKEGRRKHPVSGDSYPNKK
jgi:hypothetical protein